MCDLCSTACKQLFLLQANQWWGEQKKQSQFTEAWILLFTTLCLLYTKIWVFFPFSAQTDYPELNAQEQYMDDFLQLQFHNCSNYCSHLCRTSQDTDACYKGLKTKKVQLQRFYYNRHWYSLYMHFLVILLKPLFLYTQFSSTEVQNSS